MIEKGFDMKRAVLEAMNENSLEFALSLLRKFPLNLIKTELIPIYFDQPARNTYDTMCQLYSAFKGYGVDKNS